MPKSPVIALPPELAHLHAIEHLVQHRTAKLNEWTDGLIALHSFNPEPHILVPWPMRQIPGQHYREVYVYVHRSKIRYDHEGSPVLGDGSRRATLDIIAASHAITLSYPMIVGLDQGKCQQPESPIIEPGTRKYNRALKDLTEYQRRAIEHESLVAAGRVEGYREPRVKKRRGKLF
jgi:hypothetical protein